MGLGIGLGEVLAKIPSDPSAKNIGIGVVALVIVLVWGTQSLTLQNHLGLQAKIETLQTVRSEITSSPFRLDVVGGCYPFEGYRYLSQALGITPVVSYMDPYFEWLYPETSNQDPVASVLLIDRQDKLQVKEKQTVSEWQSQTSGNIRFYESGSFLVGVSKD